MIKRIFLLICAAAAMTAFASLSAAQSPTRYAERVVVCPSVSGGEQPDFSAAACNEAPFWAADPQGREIWVQATIDLDRSALAAEKPVGLFVSVKAASAAWLNGAYLGANGQPGASRETETPGKMDAVFFAPNETLRDGENEIVLRMSSHYGFLTFGYPVHFIGIGEYRDPTTRILRAYWPSLIPFGVLIAGALYFAASSISASQRLNLLLLGGASFFAGAQLVTEVYRGLVGYDYPAHEWRVILIVLFSGAFGLCLAAHVAGRFLSERRDIVFIAIVSVTIASTFFAVGYDSKAALAVLTPTGLSAAITARAAWRRTPQALVYAAVLFLFAVSIVAYQGAFLDVVFFYETAGMMLVFFALQARAFQRERELRASETARAKQLETALARANQPAETAPLKISSAGKIDFVPVESVAYCKGAGDYVEIFQRDGAMHLHAIRLTELEETLPASFLRVHRSYLVNADLVKSLKRESSGVGVLLLETGAEIPVSRRIMPKIRSALAS